MTKRIYELTPELLRETATHLAEGKAAKDYADRRDPFMCNALRLAGAFLKAEEEFHGLLFEHEITDGSHWRIMYETEDASEGQRQSIRFMLLHFLAHWLESEGE